MTSTPLLHASRSTRSEAMARNEKVYRIESDIEALLEARAKCSTDEAIDAVAMLVSEFSSRADRIRRGMPEGN